MAETAPPPGLFTYLRRTLLPSHLSPSHPPPPSTPTPSLIATASYDAAVTSCRKKVAQIVSLCRRHNVKYRDPHFDLLNDLYFCTTGLTSSTPHYLYTSAKSVARVEDIFDEPQFFRGRGAEAGDIRQGAEGDCWFLAACATAAGVKGLLEKVCVARDEECGVYGFVFLKDSQWISVIIDDQLMLKNVPHQDLGPGDLGYYTFNDDQEDAHDKLFMRGSSALLCASCEDPNETWLPLLEKAYAKAHGDYEAINGGYTGEAVEDLTGGVTSEILSRDILSKEKFWKDELTKVNQDYLFAAWSPDRSKAGVEDGSDEGGDHEEMKYRKGVLLGHAYSVLEAREVTLKGVKRRFLKVRNPWGKREWSGRWSDGSREWDPESLSALSHKFGDDGQFWMEYRDFLTTFEIIDRTRLFDSSWQMTTPHWLPYSVPYSTRFSPTRYRINVAVPKTEAVIVLSKVDDRFFRGLEGGFFYKLYFRVHRKGEMEDYLTRSYANVHMTRSVSVTVELEQGEYDVIWSVEAEEWTGKKGVEEMVREEKKGNRRKFRQVAVNADLAWGMAGVLSEWREAEIKIAHDGNVLKEWENKILVAKAAEAEAKAREEAAKVEGEGEGEGEELAVDGGAEKKEGGEEKKASEGEKKDNEDEGKNDNSEEPKKDDDKLVAEEDKKDESIEAETKPVTEKAEAKEGEEMRDSEEKAEEKPVDSADWEDVDEESEEPPNSTSTDAKPASKKTTTTTKTNSNYDPKQSKRGPSAPHASSDKKEKKEEKDKKNAKEDEKKAGEPSTDPVIVSHQGPIIIQNLPLTGSSLDLTAPDSSDTTLNPLWYLKHLSSSDLTAVKEKAEDHEWEAKVCVGLRVYSRDPGLTVSVVTAEQREEGGEGKSGVEVEVDVDDVVKDLVENEKDVDKEGGRGVEGKAE